MGGGPAQKALRACVCGRHGGGGGDEIWEIVNAHDGGGLGGSWSAERNCVVHGRTWFRCSRRLFTLEMLRQQNRLSRVLGSYKLTLEKSWHSFG